MAAQKTTDELKDIAREVYREELRAEITRTVEETFTACLQDAALMTKAEVEETVMERVSPLVGRIDSVESALSRLKEIEDKLDEISTVTARLSGVLNFIETWPSEMDKMRDNVSKLDTRIDANALALTTVGHRADVAMAGTSKLHLTVFGNPNNPDEPSLMKDIRNQAQQSHYDVMQAIGRLSQSLDTALPQIQANTQFRERRQRIERAALASFRFARNAIDQRKWWLASGAVAAAGAALVSNPDVQAFLRLLFEAVP